MRLKMRTARACTRPWNQCPPTSDRMFSGTIRRVSRSHLPASDTTLTVPAPVNPSTDLVGFSCPHCGAHAHQSWYAVYGDSLEHDETPSRPAPDALERIARDASMTPDMRVSEGDVSATTGHSIAVMRAVYSHPMPKERRGGTDAIAAALQSGHDRAKLPAR